MALKTSQRFKVLWSLLCCITFLSNRFLARCWSRREYVPSCPGSTQNEHIWSGQVYGTADSKMCVAKRQKVCVFNRCARIRSGAQFISKDQNLF
jgi:hypothetical protein